MKTAYIFHDAFADQYADWYLWMKSTLEVFGYNTIVPVFPTPAGQTLASWRSVMRNFIPTFDEETIFIGHGTGALFALRMVEESTKQIHGLFLVAGYAEKIGHAGFDRVNETFLEGDFKWETIQSRVMMTRVFAGGGDPYVPNETTERLAKNLGATLEIIPDGGHFNKASGYTQFVALANAVREGGQMIGKGVQMEEVSPKIQEPAVAPTPHPNPLPEGEGATPTPSTPPPGVHTMYQDMGTLVNSNQGSVASSLLSKARQDEAEKREVSPTSPKNMLYFFGALIMILVAVGVLGYVFKSYLPAKRNAASREIPSLIRAESHQNIAIENRQPYAIIEQIRTALATNPIVGTIRDIYYTNGSAFASFPQVLTAIDTINVPQNLISEFQPVFMHGSIMSAGKPAHFLVLPVKNYDTTFAGLRDWEQTMFRDVGIFMNVPDGYLRTKTDRDVFKDEMIANRTLRVLRYTKPAEITLDEAVPLSPLLEGATSQSEAGGVSLEQQDPSPTTISVSETATVTTDAPTNFISEGLDIIENNNPFANITAPYVENDIMLAYFFLTEKTVVIVNNPDIIPEILARFANRQIYRE